ncbi:toll-like receptor 8 [Mercenaria mercenaria]|uniref:toll-like receptor 8 n=1 Tax=Mercenaria mercenaria TaxID=6596 RepID=UPI00234F7891|nr:toll-like receptor 8 [Mercenaria mercenaria]
MSIRGNAMKNLVNLEELHISAEYLWFLYKNSFAGLDKLTILSLSGGNQHFTASLTSAIESKNILTNLEAFSIRNTVLLKQGKKTVKAIITKPSKSLDMNFITTDEFNFFQSLWFPKCPEKINISFSNFNNEYFGYGVNFFLLRESFKSEYTHSGFSFISSTHKDHYLRSHKLNFAKRIKSRRIKDLKVLDASYVSSPMVNGYVQYVLELKNKTITLPLEIVTLVSRAEIVNISGIYQHYKTIKLESLSVSIVQYFSRHSPTRELIVKNNRLEYLDVTFLCSESKLEKLDLSSNVIEFIHPNMCSCCTKLLEINLSSNNLFKMAERNYSLFGQLISSYQNLKNVILSSNKLSEIPTEMFHENMYLEQIDLSSNVLTKISFNLGHVLNLKTINLRNNRISVLDQTSLTNIQILNAPSSKSSQSFGILKINDNPILCSECKTLPFIKWLASTSLVERSGNNIFCKNHKGTRIHADQNAAEQLQEECDKPERIKNVIILSSVIPIAATILIVISICTWLRYRRYRLRRGKIEEKIKLIQRNQLDTRFVVFLSYSSEDTDFLNEYVYNPLKIRLQEKLQTERDIICLGDRHFQLGKPINDEMVQTLQQSAVVLLLFSRNFCSSEFCRMEFDHALFMKKPFIVMVKGEIDINDMVPSMQEVFRRNTRLLWERDGNIFVMKTSWDNVIFSILELI